MVIGRVRSGLSRALLCLLLPAGLFAQEASRKTPEAPQVPAAKPSAKPVLAEATRVSTDDAIKSAAQKKTEAAAESPTEPSSGSAVTEFRPVTPTPETSGAASAESAKTAKKSRNIHGTVYGATGAGDLDSQKSGAAVGATSKSGKSGIYVETNRSRTTPPKSK